AREHHVADGERDPHRGDQECGVHDGSPGAAGKSYTSRDRDARADYDGAMTDATSRAYAESLADPCAFWGRAAEDIEWVRRPRAVWNDSDPLRPAWFPGAMLNTCYNAVDLHVAAGRGVERGDRVLIYMPMIPEAVFGMLACARIGAIHSVVFGGFAANELAQRIQHAAPKLVLTASCGIEPGRVVAYHPMLDDAISRASAKPRHCLVWQRPELAASLEPGRDVDWRTAVANATP